MNQITLLEFCQVPENRIKLMEELIEYLKNKNDHYICWIINYDFIKFKHEHNIEQFGYCIGSIEAKEYVQRLTYFLLSDLLPELVKYKHRNPNYMKSQDVWFYADTITDHHEIRIAALKNAITDITGITYVEFEKQ